MLPQTVTPLAEQCNQKNNLEHTTIEITAPRAYHRPSIIDLLTGSHPHPTPLPVVVQRNPITAAALDTSQSGGSHRGEGHETRWITSLIRNIFILIGN